MPDLTIAAKFCGPTHSGNGGYVCGMLAKHIDAPAPRVRLLVPPPLETSLAIRGTDPGLGLFDAATCVAKGVADELTLTPPKPPSLDEAAAASRRYRGFAGHTYPRCFVCGPDRDPGDGLRIFAGATADAIQVAAPWTPAHSLATNDERVRPEFVWAALDCPGGLAFWDPGNEVAILLGELQVEQRSDVRAGEPHIVTGWKIAHEGRKHRTGTALFDATGTCLGLGLATWFEIDSRSS